MDTFVTITVYHGDEKSALDAINKAFVRMEKIVLIASVWDEKAEAYNLNRSDHCLYPFFSLSPRSQRTQRKQFRLTALLPGFSLGASWRPSLELPEGRD